MIDDFIKIEISLEKEITARIATISGNGQIFMAAHCEANVDARNRNKTDSFRYVSKMPGSLKTARGRRVTISPIGELRNFGFAN
jgi:CRISPR-associated endonuclease Csn1